VKTCCICSSPFDPTQSLDLPEQQVGLHLAEQEYRDVGEVCAACLASRGRLAMMYKTECFD
jgi:hypothetical protein